MRLLIDGYNLGLERGTGVATYARNLSYRARSLGYEVSALYGGRSTRSKDPLLSEIAFFDAAKPQRLKTIGAARWIGEIVTAPAGCRVDEVLLSGAVVYDAMLNRMPTFNHLLNSNRLFQRAHLAFQHTKLPSSITTPHPIDIAHWTYPLPIYAKQALNIYTLHDLVPLRLPHTTLDNKRRYLKMCRWIARTADHIVTVSECSRRDIINLLGVPEHRITNTYQSVSFPQELLDKTEYTVRQEIEGTFGLPYKEYFLYYGAIEPKKNLSRLIDAYLGSSVSTPLVIVGAPGWKSEDELVMLDVLKNLPTGAGGLHRIIRLEYLPLPMLVSLIRGAKATLFPSLYEGFGLPVLESMLLGTPVLCSNTSCMPEVAGSAAMLVNPYDTQAIAQGIKELDSNDALRITLSKAGQLQSKHFKEDQYEERLRSLYEKLLLQKNSL